MTGRHFLQSLRTTSGPFLPWLLIMIASLYRKSLRSQRGKKRVYIFQSEANSVRAFMRSLKKPKTPRYLMPSAHSLNWARREKWLSSVERLNFIHIGRKAWSLLRNLSSSKFIKERIVALPGPNKIGKWIFGLSKIVQLPADKHAVQKPNKIKRCQQAPVEVFWTFAVE